jgi:hypothetical protein
MPPPPAWLLTLLGAGLEAAGLAMGWQGLRRSALRRKVADTPTSRVRSAAMGPVELKGLAVPATPPALAPFSGRPCAWWRVTVEEERLRQARGGTRREWVQIHAEASTQPFELDDATARVAVDPAGAEVRAPRMLEYISGGAGIFGLGAQSPPPLGPQGLGWVSGGIFADRRRLREWRVDAQRPLYALGVLRPRHGAEGQPLGPCLGRGEHGEPYLLAAEGEGELLRSLAWAAFGWSAGALAALGLGAWLLQAGWQ